MRRKRPGSAADRRALVAALQFAKTYGFEGDSLLKGVPDRCDICPLARSISAGTGGDAIVSSWDVAVKYEDGSVTHEELPKEVFLFIDKFDHGRYPELKI